MPRIGLCWQCGDWNQSRAIPAAMFEAILIPGRAYYYSLHRTTEATARIAHEQESRVHDAGYLTRDPLQLAALVAEVDLVITVDTLVAHIAGAMGKPVWLLLPFAADWRWMHGLSSSPWYPTMRLFRQHAAGDWSRILSEVSAALDGLLSYGVYARVG